MVEPQLEPASSDPRRQVSVKRASWSSLVPGLGQLSNRQPRKAGVFFGLVVGLFLISLNIPAVTDALLGWWRPHGGLMVLLSLLVEMLSTLVFMGTFLGALLFWYGAFHDARITALEKNGRRAVRPGRWWMFRR